MKCFVTGATGFVGANLVHELVAQGHKVKALIRPGGDRRGLAGVAYETVTGDLSDRAKLVQSMRGCEWCFHVAAFYQLWLRDYRPMYQTNVEGTRTMLESAAEAGCKRIVYTSTVGCVGLPREENGQVIPSDEQVLVSETIKRNPYKHSKWLGEQVARELAAEGMPIVVVNPSAPVGPRDVKPTPTGRIIVDFLNRRMPGYLDTGLNWVHVRDVAVGHILAAKKGKVGERYILGHAEGNWTMKQTLDVLAELAGLPAPKRQVPFWLAMTYARFSEGFSWVTGKPPRAPVAGVRMARHKMWFDPAKAIRELGLPQTPPQEAFREAIAWFKKNGFVR
jgi:dihydroflavonol-4-reductase